MVSDLNMWLLFVPRRLDEDGNVEKISVRELFGEKKGVLVGVPGAFTPTCSKVHLPEFVDNAGALAAKVGRRSSVDCAVKSGLSAFLHVMISPSAGRTTWRH